MDTGAAGRVMPAEMFPRVKLHRAGNVVVLDEKNPHIRNNRDGTVIKLDVNCGEVGLVIRLRLLSCEVRSVTTALKVVEEVQEGLQEID